MPSKFDRVLFEVPAMRIPVKSGGRVKRDADGRTVYDARIVPKGRPRSATNRWGKSITYTPDSTTKFEAHIRDYFFKEFPAEFGVYTDKAVIAVHDTYLGCRGFGRDKPCDQFRRGKNFEACKACAHRRKNLHVRVTALLKDSRHVDGDNILKIVLDAMECICFYNDSQFSWKSVEVVPHAEEEKLIVEMYANTEYMSRGSLVGGYDFKQMSVADAAAYANSIMERLSNKEALSSFLQYLRRADSRKYVDVLCSKWL